MDIFFIYASPSTLVSLITDLDGFNHQTPNMIQIRKQCVNELTSIVGESEAIEMIEAAGAARNESA